MTDEEKIKYLYDRHHADRDFQLTMFWENSKYYWGFLLVCFGGYGALVLNSLWKEGIDCITCNLILIAIDVIGIVLSWAWLKMAQGCKAWYEVHENAIWKMDRDNKLGLPSNYFDQNFFILKDYENKNRTFESDSYSPTKINILLCYIVMLIWIVLLFINTILFFDNYCCLNRLIHSKNCLSLCVWSGIILFCIISLFILLMGKVFDNKIRSSELNHPKYLLLEKLRDDKGLSFFVESDSLCHYKGLIGLILQKDCINVSCLIERDGFYYYLNSAPL